MKRKINKVKSYNIDSIDYVSLTDINNVDHKKTLKKLKNAMTKTGFFILINSPIKSFTIERLFHQYKIFFKKSRVEKNKVNMAFTNSNRGWGSSKSEQVNKNYNPDFKEIFDCGPEIEYDHRFRSLPYYSKNMWPENMDEFKEIVTKFYNKCNNLGIKILNKIAKNLDLSETYFSDKFDLPMALLRCNYYPKRPEWAETKDFGVAPHTDYGCLTLLFTEGVPGLEIKTLDGNWSKILTNKEDIIINFGDMLELWSNGIIKATSHRVIGSSKERFSIPFFFNPRHDTIISNNKINKKILAGEYLSYKYDTTYKHKM